jgi:hypothetical protein
MDYHISEEIIESFSRGKLQEPLLSEFEAHYLVCTSCQDQVAQMDQYLEAFRLASAHPPSVLRRFWSTFSRPGVRIAVPALAAACAAIAVLIPARAPSAPRTVHLSAVRGAIENTKVAKFSRLTLHLDLRGIEGRSSYRAEIVSLDGSPVWRDVVKASGEVADASVNVELRSGRYWVRIYSDTGREDLLREYGLTIE